MNTHYTKTLQTLAERRATHEKVLGLIIKAQEALELGANILFQVHHQQDNDGVRAIMAENAYLTLAVQRADELSMQYNGGRRRGVELFVRIGDIRIAIDPADATLLDESIRARKVFHLDDRTAKSDRVFAETDSLPSGWYAETPTPVREEAAVPA